MQKELTKGMLIMRKHPHFKGAIYKITKIKKEFIYITLLSDAKIRQVITEKEILKVFEEVNTKPLKNDKEYLDWINKK